VIEDFVSLLLVVVVGVGREKMGVPKFQIFLKMGLCLKLACFR
jgi:hypothetical protein